MDLAKIIISETSEEQVIFLREAEGGRAFPIMIGIWEALAIDRNIKGRRTPRPMTHDLIGNVLRGLGATLDRIVITDLRDRTFYASLVVRLNGKTVEIDSRPSDAIALAVLHSAEIFVEEKVLEDVAMPLQAVEDAEAAAGGEEPDEADGPDPGEPPEPGEDEPDEGFV